MERKRILSFVIVFAMMLGLMATMPTKANADYIADLWVGGVRVTSDNAHDIKGPNITDGNVSYDKATNTLTLEDATIEGNVADDNGIKYGIKSGIDLTIKLIGKNTITSADSK
ncbi:MAG: hypothetical protein Q4P29_03315, partial [Tissierellia bacterium]|nr:hypothetical protein [Tissierellia bacterium]